MGEGSLMWVIGRDHCCSEMQEITGADDVRGITDAVIHAGRVQASRLLEESRLKAKEESAKLVALPFLLCCRRCAFFCRRYNVAGTDAGSCRHAPSTLAALSAQRYGLC
eukprot:3702345-Rhodomonas_salina.1